MLKRFYEKIKFSTLTLLVVFMLGHIVGGYFSYAIIAKDCAVMYAFRIGDFAYSCKRLAP
jgi:hypothetical protein